MLARKAIKQSRSSLQCCDVGTGIPTLGGSGILEVPLLASLLDVRTVDRAVAALLVVTATGSIKIEILRYEDLHLGNRGVSVGRIECTRF